MAWLQELSGWLGGATGYEEEQEIARRRPVRFALFVSSSVSFFLVIFFLMFIFSPAAPPPTTITSIDTQDRVAQNQRAMAFLEERANKERETQEMLRGITGKDTTRSVSSST